MASLCGLLVSHMPTRGERGKQEGDGKTYMALSKKSTTPPIRKKPPRKKMLVSSASGRLARGLAQHKEEQEEPTAGAEGNPDFCTIVSRRIIVVNKGKRAHFGYLIATLSAS